MEITSNVMRFALATYFMKRTGSSRVSPAPEASAWSSPLSIVASDASDASDASGKEAKCKDIDSDFSNVVSAHISNLKHLLDENRFQEWSGGVAELRKYAADNDLLGSLVTVLTKMIKGQEDDAECIVQVIEHMCFENTGELSRVSDKLTELLTEALRANKDTAVATWLLRAKDGIADRLRQYDEQRYGGRRRSVHGLEQATIKPADTEASVLQL